MWWTRLQRCVRVNIVLLLAYKLLEFECIIIQAFTQTDGMAEPAPFGKWEESGNQVKETTNNNTMTSFVGH